MMTRVIAIVGFSYAYGFFELFMNLRQRRSRNVKNSADKGSLWLLYVLIAVGYALSFSVGSTRIGRLYEWNTYFALGVGLVVIGLTIRILSILTLRQQFRYSVETIENHALIETGLYRSIRHPGYLGQLLIFIGIATSLSNWLSIVLMMIPIAIGYIYRMKVEERFMTEQMGERYVNYKNRTKRLIPMLY